MESGYVASSATTTPAASSSGSSSFKRKSTANRFQHHQVRIVDNRLKKPADEAALLHARRRIYQPHRFSRSCTSNDDNDEEGEEEDKEEDEIPRGNTETVGAVGGPIAGPTSSILVINPPTGSNSGPQKHVILLTGSSEPSPSIPSSEANEPRDLAELPTEPPALESNVHLPSNDKRRHSSFVSPSSGVLTANSSRRGGSSNGALKRCNTSSSVYSGGGGGEHTPTPVKSTLKAASMRKHREYEQRRQRASLPLTPRGPNSSPGVSRHGVSSDEVETDNGVGGAGNTSRLSTPMEPICVVNLATPIRLV